MKCPLCDNELTIEDTANYEDVFYNAYGERYYCYCGNCNSKVVIYHEFGDIND